MTAESAATNLRMEETEIRELGWKSSQAAPSTSRIERMQYRTPGTMSVPASTPAVGEAAGNAVEPASPDARATDFEARFAEGERVASERVEAARREGHERGRSEADERGRELLASALGQMRVALDSFQMERDAYFARVEVEVVRLALGIAARVLNREAQMDPLLLSGAVRVALGQLGETTAVKLRVPVPEEELWSEMLRLVPNLPLKPEVVGDSSLSPGDCVMEAQVGTVDLGVRAQLTEIERGFFDLLEQRPSSQRTA